MSIELIQQPAEHRKIHKRSVAIFWASICAFVAAFAVLLSNVQKVNDSLLLLIYPPAPKIVIREASMPFFPSEQDRNGKPRFYLLTFQITIDKSGPSKASKCIVQLRHRANANPLPAMFEDGEYFRNQLINFRPGDYTLSDQFTFYIDFGIDEDLSSLAKIGGQPELSILCEGLAESNWLPVKIIGHVIK